MTTAIRTRTRTRQTGARGTINSSREVNQSGEKTPTVHETSKEILSVIKDPNPAYVSITAGLTKNMGDYNSIKVAVSVSLPCEPNDTSIRETYKHGSSLVDEFLDEEFKAAVGEATPNTD